VNIFRALETEFGAEFVDENDYRFWGFSSLEAMNSGEGSTTVHAASSTMPKLSPSES
jgi:hypothetical protein